MPNGSKWDKYEVKNANRWGQYESKPDSTFSQEQESLPPVQQKKNDSFGKTVASVTGNPLLGANVDIASKAIQAVPSSLKRFGGDLYNAVTNPAQTLSGVASLMASGANPLSPQSMMTQQALGKMIYDRYGNVGNIVNTLTTDPVGMASDVSMLTGGASSLAKMGGLTKTARGLGAVSGVTDPINLAVKGIGATARGTGKILGEALGASTGSGYGAVREGLRGGRAFTDALRGKTGADEVLTMADDAMTNIKSQRAQEYQSQLSNVASSNAVLDVAPIQNKLDGLLSQYRVTKNARGKLDFSRSTLDKAGINDVQEIYDKVRGWGKKGGDNTAIGFDTLKRQLDDFYSESSNARALVTALRNEVKNQLVTKVPEYKKLVEPYEKSLNMERELKSVFSLKNNVNPETKIKKLTQSLRDSNEFRQAFLDKLEEASGADLRGSIAGMALSPAVPRGYIGRSVDMMAVTAVLSGLSKADPSLAALLAMTSPRVVGEFVNALGYGVRGAEKLAPVIRAVPDNTLSATQRYNLSPQNPELNF